MNYIMDLELFDFIKLVNKAFEKTGQEEEKRIESLLWHKYLIEWQRMNEKDFVNFEDYKNKAFGRPVKDKIKPIYDKEKILREAESIKNLDQKGGRI